MSQIMRNKALEKRKKRDFERIVCDFWDKVNQNVFVQCPTCNSWHKISLEQKFSAYVLPMGFIICSDCKTVFSPSCDNISLKVA